MDAKQTRQESGFGGFVVQSRHAAFIQGKYEAALDYFQQATETNPDDPYAWQGLGSCYIGLNQPNSAHYHLGLLFLDQGNRKLALQQYEVLKGLDIVAAKRFFRIIYPQSLEEVKTRHSIKY
jgi:tetratricopeptide (TPR) repeat protein